MADLDRARTAADLLALLELEPIDRDIFRGHTPPSGGSRVFGGHVAAQALRAAAATVESDHTIHSLHGYFMRPGEHHTPIIYMSDRIRDGRSFTTRRVRAVQHGEAIFSLSASFHRAEPGPSHQVPMPHAPDPDGDDGFEPTPVSRFAARSPFEVRDVELGSSGEPWRSTRRTWVRTRGAMPDDPDLHACVLTYLSDMGVVSAARIAVDIPREAHWGASLDHALWFHRPARCDEWLLVDLRPVSNAGARGLVFGTVHSGAGTLVASLTQETLVRRRHE